MTRLHAAAPGRADAHAHLAAEAFGEVAVAVHADGGAGGDGPPGEVTVEIQVARRAVDFDRRPGIRGGLEQRGRSRGRTLLTGPARDWPDA